MKRWATALALLVLPAAAQNSDNFAQAEKQFGQLCEGCHGEGGAGGDRAPALINNRGLRGRAEQQIADLIKTGTPAGMPPFRLPEDDLRLLARRALVRGGHEVIEAADGAEGLKMIVSRRPDLLVLDLNMPGMNGFELLNSLRLDEAGRSLPVIVLTAHGDEASAQESFALGATDFLAKPFTPPQLDARVRSCFAHKTRDTQSSA